MSTTLRVSDDTKALLEHLKRDDETFDELLERLAQSEKPINVGAWSEDQADRARTAVKRSRESFER
ncbi:antitoxin VapB family protein [Salarchaeum japonicum]|uniref:Antitoxin n=1 Tax=Salarchaeum japonicum TaxID=555573 RepID=A0AAV3SYS5_9EURY|nr:antitoxin VapB family protein [Salarchaeum japonicum]